MSNFENMTEQQIIARLENLSAQARESEQVLVGLFVPAMNVAIDNGKSHVLQIWYSTCERLGKQTLARKLFRGSLDNVVSVDKQGFVHINASRNVKRLWHVVRQQSAESLVAEAEAEEEEQKQARKQAQAQARANASAEIVLAKLEASIKRLEGQYGQFASLWAHIREAAHVWSKC